MLLIYDSMLSAAAETIVARRTETITAMQPLVEHYYGILAEEREKIGIEYRSEMQETPLMELLLQSRQRDFVNEHTSVGAHRDDIIFSIGDYPLRKFGSQGQQKSFLVSLKFAQYEIMKKKYGFAPVLLLDDVFDKLDMGRISNLLQMVSGNDFGQIFITDSNKVRMSGIVDVLTQDRAYFETVAGTFKKI